MILGVRACMLTIRHYVTNTTDSQNAGALVDALKAVGLPVAVACTAAEETRSAYYASAARATQGPSGHDREDRLPESRYASAAGIRRRSM